MKMADERKRHSRLSPRVENDGIPDYYVDSDIPHVLARVRLIDSMLSDLDDREDVPQETRDELNRLFTKALNDSLAAYALDLARSLITLEDSIEPQ